MGYDLADTGEWERVTVDDKDNNGSAGGCDECGRSDVEDNYGRTLLDFYCDVSSASLILCPSCYLEARGVPVIRFEVTGKMMTTPDYWDCECHGAGVKYIHPMRVKSCRKCKARRDQQPDAHMYEVECSLMGRRPKSAKTEHALTC